MHSLLIQLGGIPCHASNMFNPLKHSLDSEILVDRYPKWSEFCAFQERRSAEGMEQTLVVRVKCTDAFVVS